MRARQRVLAGSFSGADCSVAVTGTGLPSRSIARIAMDGGDELAVAAVAPGAVLATTASTGDAAAPIPARRRTNQHGSNSCHAQPHCPTLTRS